jgi:hypothetical protein
MESSPSKETRVKDSSRQPKPSLKKGSAFQVYRIKRKFKKTIFKHCTKEFLGFFPKGKISHFVA